MKLMYLRALPIKSVAHPRYCGSVPTVFSIRYTLPTLWAKLYLRLCLKTPSCPKSPMLAQKLLKRLS